MNEPAPMPNAVINLVRWEACREFHLTMPELLSNRRATRECKARVLVSCALRAFTQMSTTQIGHVLNRDHSTVLHHLGMAHNYAWLPPMLKRIEAKVADLDHPIFDRTLALYWQPAVGCELYGESAL